MNKTDFIKQMAKQADLSETQANISYKAFVETVTKYLKKGERISLTGFGTFEMKKVSPRTSVNPQTKRTMKVPAHNRPVLKFGKAFKDSVN